LNIIIILLYRYNSYIYKNYNGRGVSKIMSSLQKFHRRTNNPIIITSLFPTVGSGNNMVGYWLGNTGLQNLIVSPASSETDALWGSVGVTRGTTNVILGLANTNTLYAFGSAAHPAAYYAKTVSTGGYNTWYLPAKDELLTMYSNKNATPFSGTSDKFRNNIIYWSSTEYSAANTVAYGSYLAGHYATGAAGTLNKGTVTAVRPIRQYFKLSSIGQGDSTNGYWLGTAGDGVSKLVVAPKSTEVQTAWGSYGTVRGTTSTTNGLANTNTLYSFGSAAHPAAYYTKTLTTGGYNTWYLPAKDELMTIYSNKAATPFATANSFVGLGPYVWSSTENGASYAWTQYMTTGVVRGSYGKTSNMAVRAVRRV
jgi:hypothetical protein